MANQFIRLGSYGRCPRKGEPKWACISGVTAEGARAAGACNHVAHVVTPNILHGISPIEAGKLAEERAYKAKDATCRRRLRKDGVALLAGVASYPHERSLFDACDWDIYNLWCQMTIAWLNAQFGDHLLSVVEHRDEKFVHLHYYVVPTLDDRSRLNINHLHPGRYAKVVAETEGASKKNGERSYRKAMRAWQDSFHSEVSAFFRHDRYGPDRERVSRREREMQKAMEAERAKMMQEIELRAAEAENVARRRGHERYAQPYQELEKSNRALATAHAFEKAQRLALEAALKAQRQAAEAELNAVRKDVGAELEALRERLAALEIPADQRFAA